MSLRPLTRFLPALALLAFVFALAPAPTAEAQPGTNCQFVCSCSSSCDTACNQREIYCPNNQKPCEIYWFPSTCGVFGRCSGSSSCQSASLTEEETDLDLAFASSCDAEVSWEATPAAEL